MVELVFLGEKNESKEDNETFSASVAQSSS